MHLNAVGDRGHAEFAHAEMEVTAGALLRSVRGNALEGHGVRALQVGGTADEIGQRLGELVEGALGSGARRDFIVARVFRMLDRGESGGIYPAVGMGGIPGGAKLGISYNFV